MTEFLRKHHGSKIPSVWENEKFTAANQIFFRQINLFKRGASEAAEGCLVSVAAKLVKTAREIPFQDTCAWKYRKYANKSRPQIRAAT